MNLAIKTNQPSLSEEIYFGLQDQKILKLVERTLAEDFETFGVKQPRELANLTMQTLERAGANYTIAAADLALKIYPTWCGQEVRKLYHDYNWRVERKGSAEVSAPYIEGESLIDIGGGPGTFSLELLKLKQTSRLKITVADIEDWRNEEARNHPQIDYRSLKNGETLPFSENQFHSASLLYVLHHVETDHDLFLKECARILTRTLVIFEDVRIDLSLGKPKGNLHAPRNLETDFLGLTLQEQSRFIAVVDYICNHIASQALNMPVPGKYYELRELESKLTRLFPDALVTTHYHGIYDRKCYPNPEAMYVINFNKGRK